MEEYNDERTGVPITDLTPGLAGAQVVYQTHPMWTPEMEYLIFHGLEGGWPLPYALHLKTGRTRLLPERKLLEDPALDEKAFKKEPIDAALAPKAGRLFLVIKNDVYALSVGLVFRGVATHRKVASLPSSVVRLCGGISIDSKEDMLYAGVVLEEGVKWGLIALDLSSGRWHLVAELSFQVGHVQANPSITRVIMFCHETGGDAPQRMWVVNANGSGLRPFYRETYDEWVTHETWWGGMRAAFTIWPYDEVHTKQPHGVASADLATGNLTVYSQFPAWHVHGSRDGKWLVADDFERSIWLIRADTRERRLLTQGHLGEGFDTHPHPSFTPDGTSVIFTSSKKGAERVFRAALPSWDALAPLG